MRLLVKNCLIRISTVCHSVFDLRQKLLHQQTSPNSRMDESISEIHERVKGQKSILIEMSNHKIRGEIRK